MPDRSLWSGEAGLVIAKTIDGDIGVLAPGSLVQILPEGRSSGSDWVQAAVGGGFLSVADDKISILAREAASVEETWIAELYSAASKQATAEEVTRALDHAKHWIEKSRSGRQK